MENSENTTIVIDMLKQITTTLSQNQTILFDQYNSMNKKINEQYQFLNNKMDEQYKALNEKMDKQYETLNNKMDKQYETLNNKMDKQYETLNNKMDKQYKALDEKIDKHYEENRLEHIEIRNILSSIQKDVKDLRDDVDTIYALEKDSRKTIRKLL